MGVRKVVTRRGIHIRGKFPSYKMSKIVSWESQLERLCVLYLEYSRGVLQFEEQPLELKYVDQSGVERVTVPDFGLLMRDGSRVLVEVKPARKLTQGELRDRLDRAKAAAQKIGYRYLIVTEETLFQEPIRSNLQNLVYDRPPQWDRPHYQTFAHRIPAGGLTLDEAAKLTGGLSHVRRMLALQLITTDLRMKITPQSRITPLDEGDGHEFLLQ